MTTCHLSLHAAKWFDSFHEDVDLPRVPVKGDVIEHENTEYVVSTVVLYTAPQAPYVIARVPL